jgi:hypothetical protein
MRRIHFEMAVFVIRELIDCVSAQANKRRHMQQSFETHCGFFRVYSEVHSDIFGDVSAELYLTRVRSG